MEVGGKSERKGNGARKKWWWGAKVKAIWGELEKVEGRAKVAGKRIRTLKLTLLEIISYIY